MYQVKDSEGNAVTGAMTFIEAQRYMQKNRLSTKEYSIAVWMPVSREAKQESKKELPSFKEMLDAGIEFHSKGSEPGWLYVEFRGDNKAAEIAVKLNRDGFTATVCPNPSWIKIKQDY